MLCHGYSFTFASWNYNVLVAVCRQDMLEKMWSLYYTNFWWYVPEYSWTFHFISNITINYYLFFFCTIYCAAYSFSRQQNLCFSILRSEPVNFFSFLLWSLIFFYLIVALFVFKCQVADYNVAAAQQGIVYIDEVDKITKKVLLGSFIHLSLPLSMEGSVWIFFTW